MHSHVFTIPMSRTLVSLPCAPPSPPHQWMSRYHLMALHTSPLACRALRPPFRVDSCSSFSSHTSVTPEGTPRLPSAHPALLLITSLICNLSYFSELCPPCTYHSFHVCSGVNNLSLTRAWRYVNNMAGQREVSQVSFLGPTAAA